MLYLICFLVGVLVMWFLAGWIVYNIGKPLNQWFREDETITLATLLTWPHDVARMANAGVTDGTTLKPHPNVAAGRSGNQADGTTRAP